jgi:hypothetical protein
VLRRPRRKLLFAVIGAGCAAGASVSVSPAAVGSVVRRCDSITFPVSETQSIPVTDSRVTASGVTCRFVEQIFLPDIARAASAPPSGWEIKVAAASGGAIEDTCTHGRETITFRAIRKL